MQLTVGHTAPDFSLYDTEKKLLTLSDLKGESIVLLFFPLAFTSTCTKELCSVRDNIAWYNKMTARIIAISVDSLYTLAKYKEEQKLNFTLLSDFNREASIAYGSLYESFSYGMKNVSKRSAFVIDGNGVICYTEVLDNASEVPDFSSIQRILTDLK